MTSPGRTPLPDIPKGYSFPAQEFRLSEASIATYLDALGDHNACYRELALAPPLAVAAQALAALLEQIDLPGGSLHTGQEIEIRRGVPFNASLSLSGKLAQRSERAGFVISILEFEVALADSNEPALVGRTTVMAVAGA